MNLTLIITNKVSLIIIVELYSLNTPRFDNIQLDKVTNNLNTK